MAPKPIDVTIRGQDQTKPAFDSAAKGAESLGTRVKAAVMNPLNLAAGAVAAVAAVAVSAAVTFAKASVESAANADASWGRVSQAVDNAGISFRGVRGDLDGLFTKIQETTRYSDDDAASAFATLVNVSGDYSGSVKNLALVADLAAAKQLDLGTASEIVGKVMTGETGMLKRYGIVVKDGADAMQVLRDKFSGFAQSDAGTLEGKLHSIANAWDNVKEAVGRALTGDTGLTATTGALADALNKFGTWIDNSHGGIEKYSDGVRGIIDRLKELPKVLDAAAHHPLFNFFIGKPLDGLKKGGSAAVGLGKMVLGGYDDLFDLIAQKTGGVDVGDDGTNDPQYQGAMEGIRARNHQHSLDQIAANQKKVAADAAERARKKAEEAEKKHLEELKKEYDLIEKTTALTGKKASDYEKMAAIEAEMNRVARNTGHSAENRSAAIDFVTKLNESRKNDAEKIAAADRQFEKDGITSGALRAEGVHTIGENHIYARATAAPMPVVAGSSATSFGRMVATSFAESMGGEDALKGVDKSLGSLEEHLSSFTGGALAGFFSTWQEGIADVIAGHESLGAAVVKSARKAIGGAMAAEGQATLLKAAAAAWEGLRNPAAFAEAAGLFAVGSAELALAATLTGGGGGGGGSVSRGGVSASGFQQSQADSSDRGKATIVLKGKGINFNNPDELNALRDAMKELAGTRDLEFLYDNS